MHRFTLLAGLFFCFGAYAQGIDTIGVNQKSIILDTLINCIDNEYVYPEHFQTIRDSLTQLFEAGTYSEFHTQTDFVDALSNDLRRISRDRHFGLKMVDSSNITGGRRKHSLSAPQMNTIRRQNFYFKEVELLSGNIGYLRFDRFSNPELASVAVSSSIHFLENCDAIIIDLRYNYGGEEEMVKHIASHFFSNSTLINTRNFTRRDSVVESWTDTSLFVKSLGSTDLYVLTGGATASGAEAFTYGLQNHKRAMVIGERTSGAAHWVEYFYFPSLQMEIKVPVAYPSHPKTDSNWEGVGVLPNIQVAEHRAFDKAYVIALDSLIAKESDDTIVEDLSWYRTIALLKLNTQGLSTIDFSDYIGRYDKIELIQNDGYLYWDQGENQVFPLIPIAIDHFLFADGDDYVVKFERDEKRMVSGYQLMSKGQDAFKLHPKAKVKAGFFMRLFKKTDT